MTAMQATRVERTGRRRRRVAGDPLRKTGWQVRQSVAEAVKEAVESGAAESQNAFVEQALIRELRELRRRRVYDAYADAAADPVFMKDMRSATAAFENASADGLAPGEA
ncbi:MAG TPA: hypothetical protein VMN78_04165 [Longimicrobiales bacterium]|nr:hypothetical protein [Longimicrobiales bacterium]